MKRGAAGFVFLGLALFMVKIVKRLDVKLEMLQVREKTQRGMQHLLSCQVIVS